jgi:hypothetical protein
MCNWTPADFPSTRWAGALIYNLGHTYLLPASTAFYGWYASHFLVLGIGLIWLAHVGMDRFAGYSLKYDDDFKHTHLSNLHRNGNLPAPN